MRNEISVARTSGNQSDFITVRLATEDGRVLVVELGMVEWAYASTGRPSACKIDDRRYVPNEEALDALEKLVGPHQGEFGSIEPDTAGMIVGRMGDGSLTLKGSFLSALERGRLVLAQWRG